MVSMMSLWLPVAVSAVVVFVASSVIHMVLGYHAADYGAVPNEDDVRKAMRDAGVKPGSYYLPHAKSSKDYSSEAMQKKMTEGPVAMLTVLPSGPPAMGKSLIYWFLFCLLVGDFTAYVTGLSVPAGAPYMSVFRMASTVAFLGYGVGEITNSIWRAQPWMNTVRSMFDGLIYALLTAGVFGWLWPSA